MFEGIKITNNSKKLYQSALQPLSINHITLPNRLVLPAIQTNYANTDGTVSDKLNNFYTKIAQSGCGLIFTGTAVVSADSINDKQTMRIYADNHLIGLKKLFTTIAQFGSIPGIQLMHAGRQALSSVTGYDLLAPSAIPCPLFSKFDPNYRIREMTIDDIQRVQNDFVNSAVLAAKAGAKIIEIHAAHGYLLAEFLSPYTNHRTDEYGNNTVNRVRIICEILEKIRNQLQQQIAISVRISANEFLANGLIPEDFRKIIPYLEQSGMDMLNISAGTAENIKYIIPDASYGEAPFVYLTETVKQFTNVPVCTVGSINSLETAAEIISSKKADLVAIGRSQIADPMLISKSLAGNINEINKCLKCNKCLYWFTGEQDMHCAVNQKIGEV